jgi:hypothetical protein
MQKQTIAVIAILAVLASGLGVIALAGHNTINTHDCIVITIKDKQTNLNVVDCAHVKPGPQIKVVPIR